VEFLGGIFLAVDCHPIGRKLICGPIVNRGYRRDSTDGRLVDKTTGVEVTYLYWEQQDIETF